MKHSLSNFQKQWIQFNERVPVAPDIVVVGIYIPPPNKYHNPATEGPGRSQATQVPSTSASPLEVGVANVEVMNHHLHVVGRSVPCKKKHKEPQFV